MPSSSLGFFLLEVFLANVPLLLLLLLLALFGLGRATVKATVDIKTASYTGFLCLSLSNMQHVNVLI